MLCEVIFDLSNMNFMLYEVIFHLPDMNFMLWKVIAEFSKLMVTL